MRTICIVLFCLFIAKAGTTQEVNLFFDFNKSNLKQEEQSKLGQLVKDYRQSRFRIVLQGYADSVGGNSYNYDLSKQRGIAVKKYLTGCGIDQHDISMEVYGEEKAKEDQDFDRRVSVFIVKADISKPSNYYEVIESITPRKELHEISGKETAVIKGAKGTTVTFPPNAFKDRKGNEVKGPVKVEMTEYYSLKDLISKGLTTISDGKLLVSGGVVDIRAYSDTTELFLKDSIAFKLKFPGTTKNNYSTFYGTRLPDGTMNWEPEGEPWEQEQEEEADLPITDNERSCLSKEQLQIKGVITSYQTRAPVGNRQL